MISFDDIERLIAIAKREGASSMSVGEFTVTFTDKSAEKVSAVGFQIPDDHEGGEEDGQGKAERRKRSTDADAGTEEKGKM